MGKKHGTGRGAGTCRVPRLGAFCVLLLKGAQQEFGENPTWTTSTGPRSPGGEGTWGFSLGMEGLCRNRASGSAGRALLRHPPPPPPSPPASTAGPSVGHQSQSPASPRPVLCALLCRDRAGQTGPGADPGIIDYWVCALRQVTTVGSAGQSLGEKGCGGSQGCPRWAVCSARQRAPTQGHWRLCCGTPPPPLTRPALLRDAMQRLAL